MFPKLNFPGYNFKIINGGNEGQSSKVFDIVRRKYVVLTPEEWVRQHLLHYLVIDKEVPKSLIGIEKRMLVNHIVKRADLVVYGKSGKPVLIAECKAPSVKVTQATFDQAARYNLTLRVDYFVLTNGIDTFCCTLDHLNKTYHFQESIPSYQLL